MGRRHSERVLMEKIGAEGGPLTAQQHLVLIVLSGLGRGFKTFSFRCTLSGLSVVSSIFSDGYRYVLETYLPSHWSWRFALSNESGNHQLKFFFTPYPGIELRKMVPTVRPPYFSTRI